MPRLKLIIEKDRDILMKYNFLAAITPFHTIAQQAMLKFAWRLTF